MCMSHAYELNTIYTSLAIYTLLLFVNLHVNLPPYIHSVMFNIAILGWYSVLPMLAFKMVQSSPSHLFYFQMLNPLSTITTRFVYTNDDVSSSRSCACCGILGVQQEACNQTRTVWIGGVRWRVKILSRL